MSDWAALGNKRNERKLCESILSLLQKNSYATSRSGYKEEDCGFIELNKPKLYFYVQDGFFANAVTLERSERDRILEFWLDKENGFGMDNSPRGKDNNSFTIKRYVGKEDENGKQKRVRFYKFCLSDFQKHYSEVEPISQRLIEQLKAAEHTEQQEDSPQ